MENDDESMPYKNEGICIFYILRRGLNIGGRGRA